MMSLLVTVYLTLVTVIGYCPQPGSALVYTHTPWQIVGGVGSCPSPEQGESTLSQINSNISSFLSILMAVSQCGDGLWYRVAYLNMSDSTQACPSSWMMEINAPVRTCGRPPSTGASCPGEYFSTRSLQYSKVCGRVIGYQYGDPGAFNLHQRQRANSPDDNYVDGVSVTHGISRTHIWTYAVGVSEANLFNHSGNCPCSSPAATTNVLPPSFIGDNYFCESGNPGRGSPGGVVFEDDPVWDGEQCEGECCSNGKSPPWFSVTLPKPTSDDIEVRICGDEGTHNEDTPVQLLEIFIQ